MKNFDTRPYSISDFIEWYNNNLLGLSPDFQRRSVWSQNAKSYLIDTVIRGRPIPKILITQELIGTRQKRTVVDGQQRLRAIFEFYNGDLKISKAHNEEYAGYTYEMLPEDTKNEFLKYELGVDLLFDMSYEFILDIFARINTYTVPLNTQEKRNAKYIGYFKQYAYKYGLEYVRYFIDGKILTKSQVTRMAEAELAAELFVCLIGGVQTNKNTEQYYKKYEEVIGDLKNSSEKFDQIMSYIGEIYPVDEISTTNWSRVHLFYTLFTVIGHFLYGLDGLKPEFRLPLKPQLVGKLRIILNEISLKYDKYTNKSFKDEIPSEFNKFIDFSRRRTTDTAARIGRANFVCKTIKFEISQPCQYIEEKYPLSLRILNLKYRGLRGLTVKTNASFLHRLILFPKTSFIF